ncbi:MAG: SHOCT domain-containing protein [Ignavibacteriaceae bacterium]|jgi:putative membrane protein
MFFHDIFWGGIWFGWMFRMLIIVIVIWLVVHSFSRNQNNRNMQLPAESALDILKKRYARGEISKEQFEQMRKDLE